MRWPFFCVLMFCLFSCGVTGNPKPPIYKGYKADIKENNKKSEENKSNKDVDESKELKDLSE